MSLQTPDPMPAMSAPPKPTPDPAALFDRVLGFANAHYAREDWLAARDFLSLALEIDPGYPRLLGSLGSIQFQLQEYPDARTTFSAAVRQNPNDPDLHIQLAMVHLKLEHPEAAEAALNRSLGLRPDDPTALKLLADSKRDHGYYQEAGAIYGKLINRHPDQVGVFLSLAKCFFKLGDGEVTQAALEFVLTLDPANATARENLAALQGKGVVIERISGEPRQNRLTESPNTPESKQIPSGDGTPIAGSPQADFHSPRYLRNNFRRLEHLATLGLDIRNKAVLELGAGIGDLTTFFLDRNCQTTSTEGRAENFSLLAARYKDDPTVKTFALDLDPPPPGGAAAALAGRRFDIVFCYGLLYHLSDPAGALDFISDACSDLLLLETIVSPHAGTVNSYRENIDLAGAAVSGLGCRPSRTWVFAELQRRFAHVYVPMTQPNHVEFPQDWTLESHPAATRAVFVGSRRPIINPLLLEKLPTRQTAC